MRRSIDPTSSIGMDRNGLGVLDLDTCLDRLASQPVGRVAMLDQGRVVILPVNHIVDGVTVAFRTTEGTTLGQALDRANVGFEVDEVDPAARAGWSVVVQGTAEIAGAADAQRLEALAPPAWFTRGSEWVLIRPREVSGRELRWAAAAAAEAQR